MSVVRWPGAIVRSLDEVDKLDPKDWSRRLKCLNEALADAEAERIALADAYRASLVEHGSDPVLAAHVVQNVIDTARADIYRGEV